MLGLESPSIDQEIGADSISFPVTIWMTRRASINTDSLKALPSFHILESTSWKNMKGIIWFSPLFIREYQELLHLGIYIKLGI
jgi:hypothetical protein